MPSISSPDLLAGRYRLESVLGRGGMGEVRAGTDLRLDRRVAVKLLRSELADQVELRARFEREARAAARISHPNVVAVFDTGEHHGVPYIVMERLSGTSLADELASRRFTEHDACSMVTQVLSALDAAHHLGVLHRDIKPGNILRGDHGNVKVADFGIAKIAEDSDPGTTGVVFATAAYLAPERVSGEAATERSDLYSVGVVLYESLAGTTPFRADTPLGLISAISEGRAPSLTELRPDASPAVIAVVERAMATDPFDRFGSARAMADALQAAVTPRKAADDHPTVPVANVHAAPRAHTPIAHTEMLEASPQRDGTRPRSRRRSPAAVVFIAAIVVATVVTIALLALSPSGDDRNPSTPPPSQVTGSTIPAHLRDAIDRLDQSVQP